MEHLAFKEVMSNCLIKERFYGSLSRCISQQTAKVAKVIWLICVLVSKQYNLVGSRIFSEKYFQ